eukprot:gene21191-28091_t
MPFVARAAHMHVPLDFARCQRRLFSGAALLTAIFEILEHCAPSRWGTESKRKELSSAWLNVTSFATCGFSARTACLGFPLAPTILNYRDTHHWVALPAVLSSLRPEDRIRIHSPAAVIPVFANWTEVSLTVILNVSYQMTLKYAVFVRLCQMVGRNALMTSLGFSVTISTDFCVILLCAALDFYHRRAFIQSHSYTWSASVAVPTLQPPAAPNVGSSQVLSAAAAVPKARLLTVPMELEVASADLLSPPVSVPQAEVPKGKKAAVQEQHADAADFGNALPVTEDAADFGNALPVTEDAADSGNALPVTEDAADSGNALPVTEDAADLGNALPVTEDAADLGNALPVTEDAADIVALPVTKPAPKWAAALIPMTKVELSKLPPWESLGDRLVTLMHEGDDTDEEEYLWSLMHGPRDDSSFTTSFTTSRLSTYSNLSWSDTEEEVSNGMSCKEACLARALHIIAVSDETAEW